MEQLTQNLKDGHMQILEVPFPNLSSGCVLVRNHFSIISAGTEGKTVKDARLGYIGKAMARKEEVKKVIKSVKTIGLKDTYKLTMNKLDAPSALGYSCAGEVIAVADDVTAFKIGDRVACAGAGAVHAEVVCVPKNLCVLLPNNVSFEHASMATLGAIALQGVRQSNLKLGESCVVIGLGLIGQLTMQLLDAAGVSAIGVDIDSNAVEQTKSLGFKNVFLRNTEVIEESIKTLTFGHGCDSVIITASTSSTDPVDFAGEICRQKGSVIIVGNVPTGFARKSYYRKELELKMSCSYGPGRYDNSYEEQGNDYPYAFVRWTENRNMMAFVSLLEQNKINLSKLISHTFNFNEAKKAYDLILAKTEPFSGILLKYDTSKKLETSVRLKNNSASASKVKAGFIGAGSFAGNVMLPALEQHCEFTSIVTNRPNNAQNIASKYGFKSCVNSAETIFNDKETNTVFIATRHNTHAEFVLESLKAGKHFFVEKPICLNQEELDEIIKVYQSTNVIAMVGFNRRFSPLIQKTKSLLENNKSPLSINYRINAGTVSKDHWTQDPKVGGGRILGEFCHFIDLAVYLTNSKVKSVSAVALNNSVHLDDTVSVSLAFENGSVASISYFSNGNKDLEKEYLEVFSGGQVVIVNDFKELTHFGKSTKNEKSGKQDKGHKAELMAFLSAIEKGQASPIAFEDICHVTQVTFKTLESIKLGGRQIVLGE